MSLPRFTVEHDVALAELTTLQLGGRARFLVLARDEATVIAAVTWARQLGLPILVLGGGSNVVVADEGFDGLVVRMALRGLRFEDDGARMLVHAGAGETWDALVETAVARGWAGLECLSGIPGLVGATPIQNVGAYGQEVAESIVSVRALDRATLTCVDLPRDACGFGYRDSAFKRQPDAHVVLGVTFALVPAGAPSVRYGELATYLESRSRHPVLRPSLPEVRAAVRELRRRKSMLIDHADPNHRSVGSFFTNPVVSAPVAEAVVARAIAAGAATESAAVPRFAASDGQVKLSAGWLIEHAGFEKGFRRGAVGLSTQHALALVHHGGGTTDELLGLARDIRAAVESTFGVTLVPEPLMISADGRPRTL